MEGLGTTGFWKIAEENRDRLAIAFMAAIDAGRWRGEARVPARLVPAGVSRWNAYALHGLGAARRYLAHAPVPGDAPDFHRLGCFVPLPAPLRDAD